MRNEHPMIMKNLVLALALGMASLSVCAQNGNGFGIKGGLNYGGNGNYFDSARDAYENPDKNLGYHFGIYGSVGDRFYFRPELVYTHLKSGYNGDDFKMSKLDAPLLLGAKIVGPLHLFAGPSLQFILDTDFEGLALGDVEKEFTVGMHIGAGIYLGKFGIDLRYERGFSENEITLISTAGIPTGDRIDTRPDQLILSLSLRL